MSQRVNSVESSRKQSIPDLYDEEVTSNEVKSRSCCGCIFFMLVMWIWIALAVALPLDELAIRPITITSLNKPADLICGWRGRRFQKEGNYVESSYSSDPSLSASEQAGKIFFIMVFCVAPFATTLMLACCMRNGSKDEDEPYHMEDKKTRERWKAIQASQKKWNIAARVIGFVGTFGFEVGAYLAFRAAFDNCSSVLSTSDFTSRGGATMGRTFILLLSALAVTLILVIVIIALIVILTSENPDQLALVVGLSGVMNVCGTDKCPECGGGLDCCGDPTDIDGAEVGGDALCCCCGGAD